MSYTRQLLRMSLIPKMNPIYFTEHIHSLSLLLTSLFEVFSEYGEHLSKGLHVFLKGFRKYQQVVYPHNDRLPQEGDKPVIHHSLKDINLRLSLSIDAGK